MTGPSKARYVLPMNEQQIDTIPAYSLQPGDIIRDEDGFLVDVLVVMDTDEGITLITERMEEDPIHPDLMVPIYGYPDED